MIARLATWWATRSTLERLALTQIAAIAAALIIATLTGA